MVGLQVDGSVGPVGWQELLGEVEVGASLPIGDPVLEDFAVGLGRNVPDDPGCGEGDVWEGDVGWGPGHVLVSSGLDGGKAQRTVANAGVG